MASRKRASKQIVPKKPAKRLLRLLTNGPSARGSSVPRLLLAHGAGTGMDSPYLERFAASLGERGIAVVRFEFPYMERRRGGVRVPPDRAPVLLERFREVVAQLGAAETLVIGGKSMGGRMASMLADELGVAGVLCLGYPFHPPDKPTQLRTEHLAALRTRCLIVQGTRDPFGTREEVADYRLSSRIRIRWIEDGDHDLRPRRRLGHDPIAAQAAVLAAATSFIERRYQASSEPRSSKQL